MRTIRTLLKLSAAERGLLARAVLVVALVRVGLWVVPSPLLLRRVARMVAGAPTPAELTPQVKQVAWAVLAASRRVPRASCLTQALATQILLARGGYSSELKIGVRRDPGEGFAAHAWVKVGGRVLVGGKEADRYRELPDFTVRL